MWRRDLAHMTVPNRCCSISRPRHTARPRRLTTGGFPMARPVIVAGARTPIGKMHGSLAPQPAAALAGLAIRAALERAGVRGVQVDAVILGHVVQAGAGP